MIIRQAWHLSTGCLVCQSAASFLCEWCEGKSFEEVLGFSEQNYLSLLGGLTPMRQLCALLSFRCLRELLLETFSA